MGNLPEQIIALNALSASLAIGALAILIELIFGQAAGLRGLRWQVAWLLPGA